MMNKAAVEITQLRVRRGAVHVFDGIDLAVPRGQITGLLGPSGCGKTTLMRSIVGVQRITSGDVIVLGSRVVPASCGTVSRTAHRAPRSTAISACGRISPTSPRF